MYTLISVGLYGLWGFLSKLASRYMDPASILVYQTVGALVVGIYVLAQIGFKPQASAKGIIYSLLLGTTGMAANFFLVKGVSLGKASTVIVITALYPIVTIGLVYCFFGESLSMRQWAGIGLGLVAIYLLAS